MALLDFIRRKKKGPKPVYQAKRCPECNENMPLKAVRCPSCKVRVGGVDRYGKARKGIGWFSYLFCILSWVAFIYYIKWAFLQ
ncbi:MAG: hypothetical protein GXP53_00475 [Deltaproteobacteria bacterium]|nr:hypothetical protein [Deltaproteobacteria bacterium]